MKFRIIPRLDIKNDKLIKGVHLEGLRVVGDPIEFALRYYLQGADELFLTDAVASLYQRNNLFDVVTAICTKIFVPVTVGGGIRTVDDARRLFDAGADKVAVNTAAVNNPSLLSQLSSLFGKQAVVLSIQAKLDPTDDQRWLVMTDNGREFSGFFLDDWIKRASSYGFGEVLITSIDAEGTCSGYDLALLDSVAKQCHSPIMCSGGFGSVDDAKLAYNLGAGAAVIAHQFHYNSISISEVKSYLDENNISIRHTPSN